MDQGSTMKRSAVHNFAPTVTKFCVMWEGQALPHDTKFGNSRCEIVGRRVVFIWSLIHGLRWSGLIKAEPGQDGRHFHRRHFQSIFLHENIRISIQISQKLVPRGSNDNKSALVQVMAWCWTGDKPLPEQMLTQFTDAYMWHWGEMSYAPDKGQNTKCN